LAINGFYGNFSSDSYIVSLSLKLWTWDDFGDHHFGDDGL